MNYVSLQDLSTMLLRNLSKIPQDIDLIVGVPRSGMLVANILALYMNKPFADLESALENRVFASGHTKEVGATKKPFDCEKILVVEDSYSSGRSVQESRAKLDNSPLKGKYLFFVAIVVPEGTKNVDIFCQKVPNPRCFEWNLFHHKTVIPASCFDIDGVLGVDPTPEENDDGENYLRFLQSAMPLIHPTAKIGMIVSSRLEKYRPQTEEWLKSHNIQYNELCLLNGTAEERLRGNLHAKFKASVYKARKDMVLFVESDPKQAQEIYDLTKKPVYCVGTNQMIQSSTLLRKQNRRNRIKAKLAKSHFGRFLRRLLHKFRKH